MRLVAFALALLFAAAPGGARAQETPKPAPAEARQGRSDDFITPHISDAPHLEVPSLSLRENLTREIELPRWAPVHVGGLTVDLSPTKHVVMMLLAFTLCVLALVGAARAVARRAASGRASGGFSGAMEATVLYLRNEIILPNVGHHGDKYVPYCLTLFFFILVMNLLGLLPWGASATGNISVTATLAICSFLVVEFAGMRALGWKYVNTIVYWPHDMPLPLRIPISVIMTPIEFVSKLTKPLALAIRLFANMTAGHVLVLALISLVFTFGAMHWSLAIPPIAAATAIMVLELLVAFLQAFVFTLLVAVFIGQIREAAH
jgi:F-type H+-transporting ATPase subunit a